MSMAVNQGNFRFSRSSSLMIVLNAWWGTEGVTVWSNCIMFSLEFQEKSLEFCHLSEPRLSSVFASNNTFFSTLIYFKCAPSIEKWDRFAATSISSFTVILCNASQYVQWCPFIVFRLDTIYWSWPSPEYLRRGTSTDTTWSTTTITTTGEESV